MKLDLEKLLKDNTKEGVIDFDKIQGHIDNDYVNPIVASNKPDMDKIKADVIETATNDIYKGLKIEGVENQDSFNAYAKRMNSGSTELTEQNSRLTIELNDSNKKNTDFETQLKELNGKVRTFEQGDLIQKQGFNPKYKNAILAQANTLVTDQLDIEGALEKVGTDFPEWMNKNSAGGKTPLGGNTTIQKPIKSQARSWQNWNK